MSEDKKTLIDLVPESIDNAVKNITDKPTQNVGTTLADIWYLVFGGISQSAEKRKLKYSYALQEFENELQEKISKIPEDKLVEPDIQIIAPALESSKYCIMNKYLRKMFCNYISSCMNIDTSDFSQTMFIDVLKNLKPFECKMLFSIYYNSEFKMHVQLKNISLLNIFFQIAITLNKLDSYGLIKVEPIRQDYTQKEYNQLLKYIQNNQIGKALHFFNIDNFLSFKSYPKENKNILIVKIKFQALPITPLGFSFKRVCID